MFHFIQKLTTSHPKIVLFTGLLISILIGIFGLSVFNRINTDQGFINHDAESYTVQQKVQSLFSDKTPTNTILFTAKNNQLKVTDPTFQAEQTRLLTLFTNKPDQIISYYNSKQASFISKDGYSTYVAVSLSGDKDQQYKSLTDFQSKANSGALLTVSIGGSLVAEKQATAQVSTDLKLAELIAFPLLALLLVFFFRSVVAALVPLALGGLSILGAMGVVHLLTYVTTIDQYALNIITILGLGLSIDYSLLIVNRFREELYAQDNVTSAVRTTILTSGRTIFFSGLTVIICLLSLYLFPIGFLQSISLGGSSAVLVTMLGALILLPALLQLLGRHIDTWHLPVKRHDSNRPTVLTRIARFATRRPIVILIIAITFISLSALPFLRIKFMTFDYHALPAGSSARVVAEALTTNFNVQTAPITVLYTTSKPLSTAGSVTELQNLSKRLLELNSVSNITTPTPTTIPLTQLQAAYVSGKLPAQLTTLQQQTISGDTVLLTVYPVYGPTDQHTQDLVSSIRGLKTDNGSNLTVGGMAAVFYDTMVSTARYLPYSLGIIVIAMLILLTLMLRSIIIPLQAIIINSLALLVAFGVLVLIFQDGHLTHQSWLSYTGGLDVTIPILIFAVAFGLSMDYAAFLYSRMREVYDKTGDPEQAIIEGVHHTGPIITAAAGALFIVVAAFASSKIAMLQQVGVGLGVAVLVDAFMVRLFLVPAVMRLFGHASWYAPKWLRRWQIRHE